MPYSRHKPKPEANKAFRDALENNKGDAALQAMKRPDFDNDYVGTVEIFCMVGLNFNFFFSQLEKEPEQLRSAVVRRKLSAAIKGYPTAKGILKTAAQSGQLDMMRDIWSLITADSPNNAFSGALMEAVQGKQWETIKDMLTWNATSTMPGFSVDEALSTLLASDIKAISSAAHILRATSTTTEIEKAAIIILLGLAQRARAGSTPPDTGYTEAATPSLLPRFKALRLDPITDDPSPEIVIIAPEATPKGKQSRQSSTTTP